MSTVASSLAVGGTRQTGAPVRTQNGESRVLSSNLSLQEARSEMLGFRCGKNSKIMNFTRFSWFSRVFLGFGWCYWFVKEVKFIVNCRKRVWFEWFSNVSLRVRRELYGNNSITNWCLDVFLCSSDGCFSHSQHSQKFARARWPWQNARRRYWCEYLYFNLGICNSWLVFSSFSSFWWIIACIGCNNHQWRSDNPSSFGSWASSGSCSRGTGTIAGRGSRRWYYFGCKFPKIHLSSCCVGCIDDLVYDVNVYSIGYCSCRIT